MVLRGSASPRFCQKYLQLARTPVGIALAQLQHLLLPRRTRSPGSLVWSTALLGDGPALLPLGSVAANKYPVGREIPYAAHKALNGRDPWVASTTKPYALFLNVHRLPCHPLHTPAPLRTRGV